MDDLLFSGKPAQNPVGVSELFRTKFLLTTLCRAGFGDPHLDYMYLIQAFRKQNNQRFPHLEPANHRNSLHATPSSWVQDT